MCLFDRFGFVAAVSVGFGVPQNYLHHSSSVSVIVCFAFCTLFLCVHSISNCFCSASRFFFLLAFCSTICSIEFCRPLHSYSIAVASGDDAVSFKQFQLRVPKIVLWGQSGLQPHHAL